MMLPTRRPRLRALLLAGLLAGATAVWSPPAAAQDAELDSLFADAARSHAMLRMLVQQMPKGADLHNHNGGSTYAEDAMAWAADSNGCFSPERQALTPGPCVAPSIPMRGLIDRDADLYSDIVDAISTRGFAQGYGDPNLSGHRRFFRTFGRLGSLGPPGAAVAKTLEQAGLDNVLYLELMNGTRAGQAVSQASAAEPWDESQMAARLARLKPLIATAIPAARAETDAGDKAIYGFNRCGTRGPSPGCKVTVRYLLTIYRENQPAAAFGAMAYAFALADADPRYVGINIANPEDGPVSTRDYSLHMRMFAFFKTLYPKVPLTLHAGELTLGLVRPADMRFHIREAVEIAGARRIGHGVSIAYEDNADQLLARMAREKVAVEINLTSNDVILGVKGADHPLALYMAAGVPVALSTDDEGVSRSDMTNEYLRAVTEQNLRYSQLRRISRDSLTYSFLQGASLWDATGTKPAAPCDSLSAQPSKACAAFLASSPKATEQWRLELALVDYEAKLRKIVAEIPPSAFPSKPH